VIAEALALIVAEDGAGRVEMITPFTPDKLEELVDGYLEVVDGKYGADRWIAYADEEGKLKKRRYNSAATELATALGWRKQRDDYLVGTIVFCGLVQSGPSVIETHVPTSVLTLAAAKGIVKGGQE
jgi:hypothetical protein